MKYLLLIIFTTLYCRVNGQKKREKVNIDHLNGGDVIANGGIKNNYTKNYYVINKNYLKLDKSNQDKILLLNKYIDTLKKIYIIAGNNKLGITLFNLRNWFPEMLAPFPPLELHLDKKQLILTCDILDIDMKNIGDISANKLVTRANTYKLYASDRFIEIYNDYNIPVFQIELNKKQNAILLSGMFFNQEGYFIISKFAGLTIYPYPKHKKNSDLTTADIKSCMDSAVIRARLLLPPLSR